VNWQGAAVQNATAVALAPLSSTRSEAATEVFNRASEKVMVRVVGGARKFVPSSGSVATTSGTAFRARSPFAPMTRSR